MARIEPEEQDFDPETFGEAEAKAAFRRGVRLFNAGDYEDAHEEFERHWLANEGGDADFYKGLVQVCICLHHVTQGDQDGARKLYRGHRKLLAGYLPSHGGLDLTGLLEGMQRHLTPLLRARAGDRVAPEGAAPRMEPAQR